jgi:hypothetical protein
MSAELIEQQLETNITRRRIIGTGAKLAYAAPLVAASFKVSKAAAQVVSGECIAGTCSAPTICGDRCACRTVAEGNICLQQQRCSDLQTCPTGTCPSGFYCLTPSCCHDGVARCVPACFEVGGEEVLDDPNQGLVLGPNV